MKNKYAFPIAITLLTLIYVWAVFNRGAVLLGTGTWQGVLLGLAVLILPALVIVFIGLEWRLALMVDKMGQELVARGDVPLADVPDGLSEEELQRRVKREFTGLTADIKRDPDNWRTWYHAAFAYNAVGDRKNARMSLREAAKRWRSARKESSGKTV